MTQGNTDDLAAEYVLGTLDPDARQSFAQALKRDPNLQKLVGDWERRLASLDHGVEPVQPPAGLWDKIEAAVGEGGTDALAGVTLRAEEGEWQRILEGIEKKDLFFDKAARCESFLLRFAPGARLPSHKHNSAEECLVLEGTFTVGDLRLEAGDFLAFDGDTIHPETYSEHGGLVYVRGELREAAG